MKTKMICIYNEFGYPSNQEYDPLKVISEKYNVLSLPIPESLKKKTGGKSYTLKTLLDNYEKEGRIPYDGCPFGEAYQKSTIQPMGTHLLIQLKIFDNQLQKRNEKMILQAYETINNEHYELTGIVQHHGDTLKSGHYTTYLKLTNKNLAEWHHFDSNEQTKFKRKSSTYVQNQQAYILLYRKLEPDETMATQNDDADYFSLYNSYKKKLSGLYLMIASNNTAGLASDCNFKTLNQIIPDLEKLEIEVSKIERALSLGEINEDKYEELLKVV
jgi:hypothetical protein